MAASSFPRTSPSTPTAAASPTSLTSSLSKCNVNGKLNRSLPEEHEYSAFAKVFLNMDIPPAYTQAARNLSRIEKATTKAAAEDAFRYRCQSSTSMRVILEVKRLHDDPTANDTFVSLLFSLPVCDELPSSQDDLMSRNMQQELIDSLQPGFIYVKSIKGLLRIIDAVDVEQQAINAAVKDHFRGRRHCDHEALAETCWNRTAGLLLESDNNKFAECIKEILRDLCYTMLGFQSVSHFADMPTVRKDARPILEEITRGLKATGMNNSRCKSAWAFAQIEVLSRWMDREFGRFNGQASVPDIFEEKLRNFINRISCPPLEPNMTRSHPSIELIPEFADQMEIDSSDRETHKRTITMFAKSQLHHIRIYNAVAACGSRLHRLSNDQLRELKGHLGNADYRRTFELGLLDHLSTGLLTNNCRTSRILDEYVKLMEMLIDLNVPSVLNSVNAEVSKYLKTRTDTVFILINSFLEPSRLTDGTRRTSTTAFSVGAAECMEKTLTRAETNDLPQLEWIPEPNNIVPLSDEAQAKKHRDAFEHLVHLHSQDVFLNTLQQVMAARLLGSSQHLPNFDINNPRVSEKRLVSTLKARFPTYDVRNLDVMLWDMTNSEQYNEEIAERISEATQRAGLEEFPFMTLVLSREFWPEMRGEIEASEWLGKVDKYAHLWQDGYRTKHSKQVLEYVVDESIATVKIELADRTIEERCKPLEAIVISHFQEAESVSVPQIAEATKFSAEQVIKACEFWISKQVLVKDEGQDVYKVQEQQPAGTSSSASSPPRAAAVVPAQLTAGQQLASQAGTYAPFVSAMLTNQGAMPASRIRAMLAALAPGGFPFGEADLEAFLESLPSVARAGGCWRAA